VSRDREPTTGPVEVTVLVESDHLETIDDVVGALARAGLEISDTLASAGVITGRLNDPRSINALEGIEGVASVEVARTIQLPPPDEPIQ
jgi:hypothetical protein